MTLRMTDSPNVYRAIEKLRARERERKNGDLVKDEVEDDGFITVHPPLDKNKGS